MSETRKPRTLRVPPDLDQFIQQEADRSYEGNYSMAAVAMLRRMHRQHEDISAGKTQINPDALRRS